MKRYLYLLLIIFSACAPKVEISRLKQDPFGGFGPTTQDRHVRIHNDVSVGPLIGAQKNNNSPWITSSSDLFRFAEELMIYDSDRESQRVSEKAGHYILKRYYANDKNTTQFGPTNSSYLDAAIAFSGPDILEYFKSLASDETIEKVTSIMQSNIVQWPPLNGHTMALPSQFIVSIRNYLFLLKQKMIDKKVENSVVNWYWSTIQKNYLSMLDRAEKDLYNVGPSQNLKNNREILQNVVQYLTFLPNSLREKMNSQLNESVEYENLLFRTVSQRSKADDLVQVVFRIWIRLNDSDRILYIKKTNPDLYNQISKMSEEDIYYLAGLTKNCQAGETLKPGYKCLEPGFLLKMTQDTLEKKFNESCFEDIKSGISLYTSKNEYGKLTEFRPAYPDLFELFKKPVNGRVLSDEDLTDIGSNLGSLIGFSKDRKEFERNAAPVCLARLKKALENSINNYILACVDKAIREQDKNIQEIILNLTTENLKTVNKNIKSVPEFMSFFSNLAYPEVTRLIFQSSSTLPAIERQNVGMFFPRLSIRPINETNAFVTGAETLGSSLSAAYQRFIGLSRVENLSPTSLGYQQIIFGQINKMLAMLGFRKLNDQMFQSLARPFYSDKIKEIDVYKYACDPETQKKQAESKELFMQTQNKEYFVARADDCTGFEDFSKTYFAIPDQLEISDIFKPIDSLTKTMTVRGQAELIRGVSSMLMYFKDWKNIQDEYDMGLGKIEYQGFRVLPRDAFVNLSLGILSVPLRNLTRTQSPLIVFDQWGKEISLNDDEVKKEQWKVSAAMTDLTEDGPSKIVKSSDLAYLILAIDKFADATDGIEKSKASVVAPKGKKDRSTLESIQKGKKQLLQLMVGLSNFIISRFQDQDGGFWSEYSLDNKRILKNKSRSFEDQIIIIQALLKTYNRWGGEGARWSAVDSYYFMNQKLWDDRVGFYSPDENSNGLVVKPHIFVSALRTIKILTPLISDSLSRTQASEIYEVLNQKWIDWLKQNME